MPLSKKNKRIFGTILSISVLLSFIMIGFWFSLRSENKKQEKTIAPVAETLKDKDNFVPKAETFEIPILMYHYIRLAENEDQLGRNLSVSPENFEAQMKWLQENDYKTVSLSDLADKERIAISKVMYDEKRPIVLTFDDGYDDAYINAFPVLKKYGFTGTFFVIKNFTDKKLEYLTSAQIAEMEKANMEIGSHTLTHPNLVNADNDARYTQIFDSKDDSLVFCYPAGSYNTEVKELVKKANYAAAVTVKSGIATEKSDLFSLPRLRIQNITLEAFANKISAAYGAN